MTSWCSVIWSAKPAASTARRAPLDVDLDRVDADPGDLIRLDQPDEVLAVAASRVEDDIAGLRVLRCQFV